MDLDTRLLRGFVAVAEELNFTRAAERLHLAQQALSAQIRQLEERLGARLFERTTRRVELTPAGDALLPAARAVLEALDEGLAAVSRRAGHTRLRVGLSTTASVELVGQVLQRFGALHPEVEVAVRNSAFQEPTGGLAEGLADVAFVRPPFRAEGLELATVLSEPRLALLPKTHALSGSELLRPADIVDEPWIWVDGTDPVAAEFWTLAEHRGRRVLRIGAHITSLDEYFSVVSAGLAIGVAPESVTRALGASFPSCASYRWRAWRRRRWRWRGDARARPKRSARSWRWPAGWAQGSRPARGQTPPRRNSHPWPVNRPPNRCFPFGPPAGTVASCTPQLRSPPAPAARSSTAANCAGMPAAVRVPPNRRVQRRSVRAHPGALPSGLRPAAARAPARRRVLPGLDGRMTFDIEGRRLAAGPGSVAWLPRGLPHAFRVESERVELLLLITPAGLTDRVFHDHSVPANARELPALGEHLPDFEAMAADMAAAGIEIVGPPLER